MEFVRARTQEQISHRQEEIINACDELFSKNGYEGVNFKAISEITSFTRPSIYNYYQTKEEVLLDLLKREMLSLQECLLKKMDASDSMTKEEYTKWLTKLLSSHDKLLKLFSILFTFLENNSGVEKLAEFKKAVVQILQTVSVSIAKYFPLAAPEKRDAFVSAFFAYILGLYPMSHLTLKQLEAIRLSGVDYTAPDFNTMCYHGILLLLSDL